MKRIGISLLLLLIITASCITGHIIIKNESENLEALLQNAYNAAIDGDVQLTSQYAEQLEKVYVDAEKKITFFIDHSLVEDMGVAVAELPALARSGEFTDFCSKCSAASVMLKHIVNDEKLTFINIF
jgi:hypothetical protein